MKTLFAGAVIATALVTSVVLPKEPATVVPHAGCYNSSINLVIGYVHREVCK